MGAAGATATMSRDHVTVGSLISELASLRTFEGDQDAEWQNAPRRVLYGLRMEAAAARVKARAG